MNTPLQQAAQELLAKYAINSTEIPVYMFGELRKALADEQAQAVEPTGLRDAVAAVCEGWTLPDGARKMLESALWTNPAPPPAMHLSEILAEKGITLQKTFVEKSRDHIPELNEAQQVAVPMTDDQIQAVWDVAAGSNPGWCRHITYARAIEKHHGIGAKP